ncbi:MAG TPA: DUF6325 family protein [Acidimicrobiales bacterium]
MSNDPAPAVGPVEMMLIGFPGNRFDGSIMPALGELVDAGTVRVIDLVMVRKDADGNFTAAEISQLDADEADPFKDLDGEIGELFSDEDLAIAGEALAPDSSAALVLWENSWATKLAAAVSASGGQILMQDRIPADAMAEALAARPSA